MLLVGSALVGRFGYHNLAMVVVAKGDIYGVAHPALDEGPVSASLPPDPLGVALSTLVAGDYGVVRRIASDGGQAQLSRERLLLGMIGLGNRFLTLGDYARAEGVYQVAAEAVPENPAGYYGLARMYERTVELPAAVAVYRRIVQLWPDDVNAYLRIAHIVQQIGPTMDEAEWALKTVIALPNDRKTVLNEVYAYYYLGVIYSSRGQAMDALYYFHETITKTGPSDQYHGRAMKAVTDLLPKLDSCTYTVRSYERAVKSTSNNAILRSLLAEVFVCARRNDLVAAENAGK